MNRWLPKLVKMSLALALAPTLAVAAGNSPGFNNVLPLGSAFTRDEWPADPVIVEYEGVYYMWATGDVVGYNVYSSTNLVDWSLISFGGPYHRSFDVADPRHGATGSPWKGNYGVWDTEAQQIDGKFYLYYSAGLSDPDIDNVIRSMRVGVARTDHPTEVFIDQSNSAPLLPYNFDPRSGTAAGVVGADVFRDDDGKLYIYFQMLPPGHPSSIYVKELADPMTIVPGTEPLTTADLCIVTGQDWNGSGFSGSPFHGHESYINEGTTTIKYDEKYYLFYSGAEASTPNYHISVAVADEPVGPWKKQTYTRILRRDDPSGVFGPGHGHFLFAPNGVSPQYFHHQKLNAGGQFPPIAADWYRKLAISRFYPVAQTDKNTQLWASHAQRFVPGTFADPYTTEGQNVPLLLPRPRLALQQQNFDDNAMPSGWTGNATFADGKVQLPNAGNLTINLASSTQNSHFEWWVRTAPSYVATENSRARFLMDATILQTNGTGIVSPIKARVGLQINLDENTLELVQQDPANGATAVLSQHQLPAWINWTTASRKLAWTKVGSRWEVEIDETPICSFEEETLVAGNKLYVQSVDAPLRLDAFRHTAVIKDGFETDPLASGTLLPRSGAWGHVLPSSINDGLVVQTDIGAGWSMAVLPESFSDFEFSADFNVYEAASGQAPRYGIAHNFQDQNNYLVAYLEEGDGYSSGYSFTTAAVVNGIEVHSQQVSEPNAFLYELPAESYHGISVTTLDGPGNAQIFVYRVNGREIARRQYSNVPGVPSSLLTEGNAAVLTSYARVEIDNVFFTGKPGAIGSSRGNAKLMNCGDGIDAGSIGSASATPFPCAAPSTQLRKSWIKVVVPPLHRLRLTGSNAGSDIGFAVYDAASSTPATCDITDSTTTVFSANGTLDPKVVDVLVGYGNWGEEELDVTIECQPLTVTLSNGVSWPEAASTKQAWAQLNFPVSVPVSVPISLSGTATGNGGDYATFGTGSTTVRETGSNILPYWIRYGWTNGSSWAISVVTDAIHGSVVKLRGNTSRAHWFSKGSIHTNSWNDSSPWVSWWSKTEGTDTVGPLVAGFPVQVTPATHTTFVEYILEDGPNVIVYDNNNYRYLIFRIGSSYNQGQWNLIQRNIAADITSLLPTTQLVSVKTMYSKPSPTVYLNDVTLTNRNITFTPGQTDASLTIEVVDDAIPEPAETIVLTAQGGTYHLVGAPGTATYTINASDLPPNDIKATATVLSGPGTIQGPLTNMATNEPNACGSTAPDVWYQVSIPYGVDKTITVVFDDKDPSALGFVELYSEPHYDNPTPLVDWRCDRSANSGHTRFELSVKSGGGNVHHIRVGSTSTALNKTLTISFHNKF